MTHTELYVTWAILAAMMIAIAGLAKTIERLREEVEEFRQYMMGEKMDDDLD